MPALAQTSLTLYGIADAGVQVSRFGNGTQTNLASGMADGSRLGFKGTEDLGGGFKALFTLESRIDAERVARERAVQEERAAREKAVQEERDARLALQTKIVTFISLATGIVSALMFLLNLFAPLLRNLFNLPSP